MFIARFALAILSASSLFAQKPATSIYEGPALPPVVHICFAGCSRGDGMTLYLENGRYVAKDAEGVAAAYEIVKFTKDSVVITRTDYRPRPANATLTGRLSADGTALVDGKAHWVGLNGTGDVNPFQMAWGAAIATVPGGPKGQPPQVDISAIPACNAQTTTTADAAYQYGVAEMKSQETRLGLCWLEKAADLGSDLAQANLAVIYYRGMFGVAKDSIKAFVLALDAAKAGNPLAEECLAVMYAAGEGAPKDPEQAEYWRAKYQSDIKRQQDSGTDITSLLNRKTPYGLTPLEFLRGVLGDPNSGEYTHYDKECKQGNFDACLTRDDMKQSGKQQ